MLFGDRLGWGGRRCLSARPRGRAKRSKVVQSRAGQSEVVQHNRGDGAENGEAWRVDTARQGLMGRPGEVEQEPTRKVVGGVDQVLTMR